MTEAKLAPNLPDWMLEHAKRYLASGGKDGHMYKITQPGRPELTVPSLLLTTTAIYAILPNLRKDLPYDPLKSFTPILPTARELDAVSPARVD